MIEPGRGIVPTREREPRGRDQRPPERPAGAPMPHLGADDEEPEAPVAPPGVGERVDVVA